MMSAFDEHLIGEEIEGAVAEAAWNLKMQVTDFSMGTECRLPGTSAKRCATGCPTVHPRRPWDLCELAAHPRQTGRSEQGAAGDQ